MRLLKGYNVVVDDVADNTLAFKWVSSILSFMIQIFWC